jgi:hypothetical protein
LFNSTDAGLLSNAEMLPLIVTATCLNGFFPNPLLEYSIAEELARKADGGGIAVWAPTALGVPLEQQILFDGLFDALFASPTPSLGEATTYGKIFAFGQGISQELMETYTLFGDPATHLQLAPAYDYYLPAMLR